MKCKDKIYIFLIGIIIIINLFIIAVFTVAMSILILSMSN